MTAAVTSPARGLISSGALITGIVLAALAEAIAGTVLALGRNDIIGDTHATPDEFAWLDVSYTALKLMGFVAAPWLMTRMNPHKVMLLSTLAMGLACGCAALTTWLNILIGLRVMQGFAGGVLLVVGQAIIFLGYPMHRQPMLQVLFAIGSVVAPATMAPAFQGWLIDSHSWTWIFLSILPITLSAAGLLLIAGWPTTSSTARRPFDWFGFSLVSLTCWCFTYVLSQGSRWDWFEEPRILYLTVLGTTALIGLIVQQMSAQGPRLLDFNAFHSRDFAFAFIASFIAGAALFGSSYLIPSFAISVLAFTPTAVGQLLLPSSATFLGSLLITALLIQRLQVPPVATVPFGILILVAACWMLSGSTTESGADDMTTAVLLRGLGLGFLFLSLTLVAFRNLTSENISSGIGIFNAGRQLGGLLGVAWLQTMIADHVAGNFSVLSAHVSVGSVPAGERLASTGSMLVASGMDIETASRAATSLLLRATTSQSTVTAYDTAFNAIALLLIAAAPLMVTIKLVLGRCPSSAEHPTRTGRARVTMPADRWWRQAA